MANPASPAVHVGWWHGRMLSRVRYPDGGDRGHETLIQCGRALGDNAAPAFSPPGPFAAPSAPWSLAASDRPPTDHRGTVAQLAARLEATLLRPEATVGDIAQLCELALDRRVRAVCVSPVYVGVAARLLAGSGLRTVTVAGFPSGTTVTAAKVAEVRAAAEDGADEVDVVLVYGRLLGGEPDAAVAAMRAAVGDRARVKAAGGNRGWSQAVTLLDAGADSLGCSAVAAVLAPPHGADWARPGPDRA